MSAFALSARTLRQTGFRSLRATTSQAGKASLAVRSTPRVSAQLSLRAQRYLQTYNGAINVDVPPSSLSSVPSGAEKNGQVPDAVSGKLYPSAEEAIKDVKGGITVLSAGECDGV